MSSPASSFRAPIGKSDFRKLRASGAHYVDKTWFVRDVLASSTEVMLFLRPRRFGKTLNLSTLRWFVERGGEPVASEVEDLEIWSDAQARQHFQRYPVISLTFKDVHADSYEEIELQLAELVAREAERHAELETSASLSGRERARFSRLAAAEASRVELQAALLSLTGWLRAHHGEPAFILIDEYDAPIHTAAVHGFGDRMLKFFRTFLSAGLKDNPHLHQGVLTGILRIGKESLFSGLNSLAVYGPTRPEYGTAFGFTDAEVVALLEQSGTPELHDKAAEWYDGYAFDGQRIYNPWSIMSLLDSADHRLQAYWVATSSDELLRKVLLERGHGLRDEMVALLEGQVIEAEIDENVSLPDLEGGFAGVWSFLLYSGYLTADGLIDQPGGRPRVRLRVPNREVRDAYVSLFSSWFDTVYSNEQSAGELVRALLAGDTSLFSQRLSELVLGILSFHMTGGREAERVYHAFLLGLLARLEGRFELRSERESGHGRADVLVLPKRPGEPRPGQPEIDQVLQRIVSEQEGLQSFVPLRRRGPRSIGPDVVEGAG